ncbi:uncharacterized protein [Ptychodera flava]|uniref:uncharacterized protein n=1 Tax=Ptychodera flava TaxID=63121 RepID=UPI00396A292D
MGAKNSPATPVKVRFWGSMIYVDTGKTTSLKVLCNLFRVADSFHASITEAVLKRILSQSTLPCVVDDVDSVRGIEKLAVRYFNGGAQTDSNGTYSPVTTFLCSANFVLGENARLATRCLLVPFTLPSITPTTTDQYKYFESYIQVAIQASSGIGQLLAVGSKFVREQDIVKDIYKKEVENVLRGKHPRLQSGYAALLYMMHEILLLGGRHKTVEEMGRYFKDLMVPIIDDLVTLQEDKSSVHFLMRCRKTYSSYLPRRSENVHQCKHLTWWQPCICCSLCFYC